MPFEIQASALGIQDTINAIDKMADKRGRNWKRSAFLKSGYEAFKPAVRKARANASLFSNTGLTSRSLVSSKGRYNRNYKTTQSGVTRKGYNHEYTIGTTLSPAFGQKAPKNRKGKVVRYPFMSEVGVPPQRYARISKDGNLHHVDRKASRSPQLFQHKALGATADKVVSTWGRNMNFYVGLFAKSEYATLRGAHNNFIKTGGKGKKWK